MTKRRSASNWVDRDEPLAGKLVRCLSYQFGRAPDDPALESWASIIRGMVEADASEVQLSAYLQTLPGAEHFTGTHRRLLAIALWHVTKAGLVRDVHRKIGPSAPAPLGVAAFLEQALADAPTRVSHQPPPGTPRLKGR